MGGFNPLEQNTLQALLTGLQGGMSGSDAAAMFGSVLQAQQARQQQNRELMMSLMGQFGNMAGESTGPDASLAYLNAIQQSGLLGPKQIGRLANYNAALYPGDNQSPLHGLIGDPNRTTYAGLDDATALTGIPDTELARWGQGMSNGAVYNFIVTQTNGGKTDPSDIYEEMAKDPVMGFWASQNQQAALQAIQQTLGANPNLGDKGLFGTVADAFGDYLVPWMSLSAGSKAAAYGAGKLAGSEGIKGTIGAALSKVPNIPGPVATVKGLPGLISSLGARLGIGGGAAAAAEAAVPAAAAETLTGVGGTALRMAPYFAGEAGALGAGAGTAAATAGGGALATVGLPLLVAGLLTLGGLKLTGSHMFGMNDNKGFW